MEINETLKAYAAGVFDADGIATISVIDNGTALCVDVYVLTKGLNSGYKIINNWGSKLCHASNSKYSIKFSRVEALKFLKDIRPYIIDKQERVDILIAALEKTSILDGANSKLSIPKKRVPGITPTLAPFYDQLQLLDKQSINKRVYTPNVPTYVVPNFNIKLADIKRQITR